MVSGLKPITSYSALVSRAQLRKADQEVTATAMIHKLKGYSTKGKSYTNFVIFNSIKTNLNSFYILRGVEAELYKRFLFKQLIFNHA